MFCRAVPTPLHCRLPLPALLALLALLCAMPFSDVASAAYPGRNGAIAFTGERRGESVIYVRAGGRTRGFLRGGVVADPVWSPQGRRLAVTRELPDVGRGVWILNDDATSPRQLTPSDHAAADPTWSPAGRSLAYAAGPHGARTIHLIGADGSNARPLTAGPRDQHDPAWSRRNRIAFVQTNPLGDDIYRIGAGGGTPRRLTFRAGDDKDPAWSPRGDRIAWVRGRGGIWVMSQWGNGARKLTHVPGGIEQGVAWSPDGRKLVFAGGRAGARQIYTISARARPRVVGKGKDRRTRYPRPRPISLPTSNGSDPDWRPVGHDPVIAAAGDIGCPPLRPAFNGGQGTWRRCRAMHTSNLLLRSDLAAVLPLGDVQPPHGELAFFHESYGPSWGRLRPITRPVPGNHEYGEATPRAEGYFDYFNGVGERRGIAGDRRRGGYYSYDVGRWHLIALNSACNRVPGGCDIGSPQQRWLERDLQRKSQPCTLAYWHHPRYSSLAREGGRGPRQTLALWRTLHDAGADLVLTGHQHFYERLGAQDSDGNADPVYGIRSFVVGTGGHSLKQASFRDANSQVFDATTFGVLELTLHPRSFTWRFRSVAGSVVDRGTTRC